MINEAMAQTNQQQARRTFKSNNKKIEHSIVAYHKTHLGKRINSNFMTSN